MDWLVTFNTLTHVLMFPIPYSLSPIPNSQNEIPKQSLLLIRLSPARTRLARDLLPRNDTSSQSGSIQQQRRHLEPALASRSNGSRGSLERRRRTQSCAPDSGIRR